MFLTSPILTYDVITDPFPLLASAEQGNLNKARLIALASNGSGADVVLQGIIMQLPVGRDQHQLTFVPDIIEPVAPPNWTWSRQMTPDMVQFTFYPQPGHATLPNGASLVFTLKNIEVNRTVGTFALQITEGSGDCVEPDCPIYTTSISKFPNTWGQVSFSAKPANIPYQGNTVLRWSGPQGATYTIEYIANGRVVNIPEAGDPPLGNDGQYPGLDQPLLTLEATTVFTLNISQRIGNDELRGQEQVTVGVAQPPPPKPKIVKFKGSVAVDGSQLQLTLSWVTEFGDQITITGIPGLQKASDTVIIRPPAGKALPSTYTLEARTSRDAVTSTVSILWRGVRSVPVAWAWRCALMPDGSRLFCPQQPFWGSNSYIEVLDVAKAEKRSGSIIVDLPRWVAGSPDSKRVYVTRAGRPIGKLNVYDPVTLALLPGSPDIDGDTEPMLAVTPDNQRVYVSSSEVFVYDALQMKQVGKISTGKGPRGIAFTPDGSRAFVALSGDAAVSVIDTKTLKQIRTIPAGSSPVDVTVTPDGKQLYVANQGSGSVSVFDTSTFEQLAGSPIAVAGGLFQVEHSPDGSLIFALGRDRLNVIDTASRTLIGSQQTSRDPGGIAVAPDGMRVFMVNQYFMLPPDSAQVWVYMPFAAGGVG